MPCWCKLLPHCAMRAEERAICTAGSSSDIKMPMMTITTSNSTKVNAERDAAWG